MNVIVCPESIAVKEGGRGSRNLAREKVNFNLYCKTRKLYLTRSNVFISQPNVLEDTNYCKIYLEIHNLHSTLE